MLPKGAEQTGCYFLSGQSTLANQSALAVHDGREYKISISEQKGFTFQHPNDFPITLNFPKIPELFFLQGKFILKGLNKVISVLEGLDDKVLSESGDLHIDCEDKVIFSTKNGITSVSGRFKMLPAVESSTKPVKLLPIPLR